MEPPAETSLEMPPSPRRDRSAAMGTDPLGSLLLRFSGPAIVAMASGALYNVVDAIFLGHVGSRELAAVTVAFPVMVAIMAVSSGTGVGAASYVARVLGSGDEGQARQTAGNTVLLCLVWGVLTPVVLLPLLGPILKMCGASADVLPLAQGYTTILVSTAGITFFIVSINAVIRSEGNAWLPMVAMLVASLLNIALDPIFIFVLDMGVEGAAWATVVSRFVGMTIQLGYLLSRHSTLRPQLRHLLPRPAIWLEIYRTGLASSARSLVAAAIFAVMNSLASGYGDLAVAAVGIVLRLTTFVMMPCFGLTQGYLPLVGYNFGAGDLARVRRVTLLAAGWSAALTTTAAGLFVAFPAWFVRPFAPDPELAALAAHALRLFCPGLAVAGASVLLSAFFQGIGRGFPALALTLARQAVIFLPALMILPRFYDLDGVFLAQPLSDVSSFFITVVWVAVEFRRLGIPLRGD